MKRVFAWYPPLLVVVAMAAVVGFAQTPADSLQATAQALFQPLPDVMLDPERPFSQELVDLGKMLYYDPRLSLSGFVSCNSCHNLATYGVDNLPTSLGHRWAVGPRNAPTVLNAALHSAQFWDGRAKDVEEQAQGPVLNPIEMAMPHADYTIERLASMPGYVDAFAAAYPSHAEPLTYVNMADAIGAFERTLTTPDRFDDFLKGESGALSALERLGLEVFIQYGCASCHAGPALGGDIFARFGIVESYWEATREFVTIDSPTMTMDVGVFAVTQNRADLYVFKAPSLRNITRTYPYFHDGSVWDLADATQIMARVQLGREIPEADLVALMAFYQTLEGEIPAYALQLPVLPASGPHTPRPRAN
jgi:cytochrome c peroxidase